MWTCRCLARLVLRSSYRSRFLALVVLTLVMLTFAITKLQNQTPEAFKPPIWMTKEEQEQICQIPSIDPFDKQALDLIYSENPDLKAPPCLNKTRRFVSDLRSSLVRLNTTSYFWKNVSCCYFESVQKKKHKKPDKLKPRDNCTSIAMTETSNRTVIPASISNICVICKRNKSKVYEDCFSFLRRQRRLEQLLDLKIDPTEPDRPNIIYLGLDGVSMRNFQRFLPKTHKFLMKNLFAIELTGLNKVGRGTAENLTPVLTGCAVTPNEEVVYPTDVTKDCTPIWELFSTKGYRSIHTIDHYWPYIYMLKRHKSASQKHSATYYNLQHLAVLNERGGNEFKSVGCFKHQFAPEVLKEKILEVASKFHRKTPYFHFIWSTIVSHDYIVGPKYLDAPFYKLMVTLKKHTFLKNSVLIVNSDHGLITSKYSRTREGLIEARQPLLYIVFPKWFKVKYSEAYRNLQANSKVLITPFDLHQTLKDLSSFKSIANAMVKTRSQSPPVESNEAFGISLFLPIPPRSCKTAHVPFSHCSCTPWDNSSSMNLTDPTLTLAVSQALDTMNTELKTSNCSKGKCRNLDLWKIIDGKRTTDKNTGRSLYNIRFQTLPGEGIFNALIEAVGLANVTFSVIGTIERQNLYGSQSNCLKESTGWARSACYCINHKSKYW